MASNGSVWNPENIKDVAESIGIGNLSTEVVDHLTRDVEFRIGQILLEALSFMRHAKRTTLFTADISQALRVLDIEPLYGYESTRPLKFGEASIGPGQPLYYLEDEEVDFEKLINAPLPKVPREITFTAHWLAVEGVQPTIPQNPTPADSSRTSNDLLPKGPGANQHLAATAGADDIAVKPLVKHILSKELQLYFEHVCAAVLDESNDEYRTAAFSSLRSDPGLHQLVPYFVQFVAEKVTHSLKNLFILTQMLHLVSALLENKHLHISPYVSSLVPPVLTCLVGKRLGPASSASASSMGAGVSNGSPLPAHYQLRDLAASILHSLTRKDLVESTPTLKPRLARSLLKTLLSTTPQPLGTYYGAILGLNKIAGSDGVRSLVLPHLAAMDEVLKDALSLETNGAGYSGAAVDERENKEKLKRREVDAVVDAVVQGLEDIEHELGFASAKASAEGMELDQHDDATKKQVLDKLGEVIGSQVMRHGRHGLIRAVVETDVSSI